MRKRSGQARLVAAGDERREVALSGKEITVGSETGNTLLLREPGVSRRHAILVSSGAGFAVRDLASTNGTFVNGRRISTATALKDGDRVAFASARFDYHDSGADPRLRRASPIVRAARLMLVLFAIGFAAAEYLMHRAGVNQTIVAIRSRLAPEAIATLPIERHGPIATTSVASHASTPAVVPSPTSNQKPSAPEAAWLVRMNHYRAMAKLASVSEDPALSNGDFNHARYMIKNRAPTNGTAHDEDPHNRWYTPEGQAAARDGDLIPPCEGCPNLSGPEAIDLWMVGVFHRLLILNPELRRTGFGEFHEGDVHAYAINLGLAPRKPFDPPLEFPPDRSTVSLGPLMEEWPDPLASCPGYSIPAGLPITIELGPGIAPQVSGYSLKRDGKQVEVCEFDQTNYSNSDSAEQQWARTGLQYFGAIVLVPRYPLSPGEYRVSVTSGGAGYAWSFGFSANRL